MPEPEIEIQINTKRLEFVRLSEKSVIYVDNHRVRTYMCLNCGAIVHSKTDHTRFHQNIVDMIAKATNDEELSRFTYTLTEVNKIVKERNNIVTK